MDFKNITSFSSSAGVKGCTL